MPASTIPTPSPGAAFRLGHELLEPAWVAPAQAALQALQRELSPRDAVILTSLSQEVGPWRQAAPPDLLRHPEGLEKVLPVTTVLLQWSQAHAGPAVTTMVSILANLALGEEGRDPLCKSKIQELATYLRVCIKSNGAPLAVLLAGAPQEGILHLVQHINKQLAPPNPNNLHQKFNSLWRRWLRHRVARWIQADPVRLADTLAPDANLLMPIDAPELPILDAPGGEQDDQIVLTSIAVEGEDFAGLKTRSVHALATAKQVLRRSGDPGLSLSPDQILPVGVIQRIARASMLRGQAALAREDAGSAEPCLALAFMIAGGLREAELGRVVWGRINDADYQSAAVDPSAPVLWLRLKRPPNTASSPEGLDALFKPCAEVIAWPLPVSLHLALQKLRDNAATPDARFVFPGHPVQGGSYWLRGTVDQLVPGAQFGAGLFRPALAARLTEKFGPEVVQWVLRDTFSTSLGPAYYTWVPEREVMAEVARIQSDWFGEAKPPLHCLDQGIGSRIAPTDALAREWPTLLTKQAYAAARTKGGWRTRLISLRNKLAGALCALTGLRPGQSLGALSLDSVVPEYGLVILEDKQVDVLRRTRLAATGRRWTAALKEYLKNLADLCSHEDPSVAGWANAVLHSEQPLFSAPDEHGVVQRLSMAELRATMPETLRGIDNYYRHRLNQQLQESGLQWELRHGQLGWVVSPNYALADCSPLSARSFGEQVGAVLDQIALRDGWYTQRQRTPRWSWDGLPGRLMINWSAEVRRYEQEHAAYTRRVRDEFTVHRKSLEMEMLPRLATAVEEFIPLLKVDVERRVLAYAFEDQKSGGPVPLTSSHYTLLKDRVRKDDQNPMTAAEALAAEYLIYELVTKAIRQKIVLGPEPPRRHLGANAQLSPFLPGVGLAVRHAETFRLRLAELTAGYSPADRRALPQATILAHTPYRTVEEAAGAVGAAAQAQRASSRAEWLRVPALITRQEVPMIFAGGEAALLVRRGIEAPTVRPLSQNALQIWVEHRFADVLKGDDDSESFFDRVLEALQVAGRVELSGPERLLMEGCRLAAVTTQRSLAVVEDWPLRTGDGQKVDVEAGLVKERLPSAAGRAVRSTHEHYRKLTASLNPELPQKADGKSDGNRGWRQAARRKLQRLLRDIDRSSNLGLLTEYFAHRLISGGKKKRNLAQKTLHKELTRFGGALLEVMGDKSILTGTSAQLQEAYLAVLCAKPERTRSDVLEELKKFQRHLEKASHVEAVDFAPLQAFTGPRLRHADAGTLSDREVARVLVELQNDLEREMKRTNAGPSAVRACELRIVFFLLLESSGVRPSSVHGLVLPDLHLIEPGADFIHVHRTGDYGAAKTATSVGFIKLEGELWARNREWVCRWLDKERALTAAKQQILPVLSEAIGSRRRFARGHLTSRFDALLKWATGDQRARSYWLRKRRVNLRIGASMWDESTGVRGVYRALRASGHVNIVTTLTHYVSDPAVATSQYLSSADLPDRMRALLASGLPASVLDSEWHRKGRDSPGLFHKVVLDRLQSEVASPPEEWISEPPVMFNQKDILPRHIELYAREIARHGDKEEAMERSGLTGNQVAILESNIKELVIRRGKAPWNVGVVLQGRGVMKPARRMAGSESIFRLLDDEPSESLVGLAQAWATQGYVHRRYDDNVILVLDSQRLLGWATQILQSGLLELHIRPSGQGAPVLAVDEDRVSSLAAAVHWALVMVWLYYKLLDKSSR